MEYDNWLNDQQMNDDEAMCAVMDLNAFTCDPVCEFPDGNWIAKPCTEKHPYLCKYGEGKLKKWLLETAFKNPLFELYSSYLNVKLFQCHQKL